MAASNKARLKLRRQQHSEQQSTSTSGMGLSPQDIQYLEELTEMYRLGHLSDAAFKHATNLVMTKHAKALSGQTARRPASPQLKIQPTATRTRLTAIREPAVLSRTPPEPQRGKKSAKRSTATVDAPRSSSSTSHTVFSMRDASKFNRRSVLSTVVTVLVTAGIALTASESTPFTRLVHGPEVADATASAAIGDTNEIVGRSIEPLFGPAAVAQCKERCELKNDGTAGACVQGCQRLSLAEYGRRITLKELDPNRDANVIGARCANHPIKTMSLSTEKWADAVGPALALVETTPTAPGQDTFGSARLQYTSFVEARQSVVLPRGGSNEKTQLARELANATCLHAHLALTELAAIIAAENSDNFSKRFYQRLHQSLRVKLDPIKQKVLRLGQEQPSLSSVSSKTGETSAQLAALH